MSKYAVAVRHVVTRLSSDASLLGAVGKIHQGTVKGSSSGPNLVVQSYGPAPLTMFNRRNALATVELYVRVEARTEKIDPLVPLLEKCQLALDLTSGTYEGGTVSSCYVLSELDPTDEVVNGQNVKSMGLHLRLTVS